jgi:ornithine cyclodeaminase/alanine dehydrogenase-like protein (mu-crystallin family)
VGGEGILYLSRPEIETLGLGMAEIVAAVERAFGIKGVGGAAMPPKTTLHGTEGAFVQVMAAWVEVTGSEVTGSRAAASADSSRPTAAAAMGVKLVSVFPANADRGLAVTNALIVLADPQTGLPIAVMDGGLVTALRTGASVGVAARHLAAPEVDCVGVLGCGAQARTSVRGLAAVLPCLREVRCHDLVPASAARFAGEMQDALMAAGIRSPEIVVCAAAGEVCRGAGVVVSAITMASDAAPPLHAGLLEQGALAVALDYDAAWTPAAMAECERFVADDRAQTIATKAHGVRLAGIPEMIDADLGEVVAGLVPGRTAATDRVFCLNLGVAVEDVVCAGLVYDRALSAGVGTRLPR